MIGNRNNYKLDQFHSQIKLFNFQLISINFWRSKNKQNSKRSSTVQQQK